MTRPTRSRPHTHSFMLGLAVAVLGWPAAGVAQVAASVTQAAPEADTIRLSDAERNAILGSNTVESAAAARGELSGVERAARGVHGEVGVMIGTNGTRGIYGVAAIPLGEHGEAVVSFENSQYGGRRRR